MKNLRIAVSPLTNRIYAGQASKHTWKWKEDVTDMAIDAVAVHLLETNQKLLFRFHNGDYEMTIVKVNPPAGERRESISEKYRDTTAG